MKHFKVYFHTKYLLYFKEFKKQKLTRNIREYCNYVTNPKAPSTSHPHAPFPQQRKTYEKKR